MLGVSDGSGNGRCKGYCTAQKLAYLAVSGCLEPVEDLGVEYWRQLCERFGIRQYDHIAAYGLDFAPEKTEEIMAEACEQARALARTS